MENGSFIEDLPVEMGIFQFAMLNYQREINGNIYGTTIFRIGLY
jgi:hypothetical protein